MEDRAEKIREVLAVLRGRCQEWGEDVYKEDFKAAWGKAPRVLGYKYIDIFMAVDFQDKYATFDLKMEGQRYSDLPDMREAYVTHAVEMGLLVQFLAKDGTVLLTL